MSDLLVLGDAHADDPGHREAMFAAFEAVDPPAALQTGDLLHYDLPAPTWFVAGNDEDHDVVASLRAGESPASVENLHLLSSDAATVGGLRVGGLSGTHAPTRYDCSRAELEGDRRRHFVRADVERATQLDADVFLTHEAPHGLLTAEGDDVGCRPVDEVLEAVEPELCLVGHHHEHAESEFGPTRVVALAPAWESHYRLDPASLALERHDAPE